MRGLVVIAGSVPAGFVQPDLTHRRAVKQSILIARLTSTDHLKISKLKHGYPDNLILI